MRNVRRLSTSVVLLPSFLFPALAALLLDQLGVLRPLHVSASVAIVVFGLGGVSFPRTIGRWMLGLTVFLLGLYLVIAFTPLMRLIAREWVRADLIPRRTGAVVVLGDGVLADGTLTGEGADRLLYGLEVSKRIRAPLLVTSAVRRRVSGRFVDTRGDQERLIMLAGYSGEWVSLSPVSSTRDEADRSRDSLAHRGINDIVVITSAIHTRRACRVFETRGFSVSCLPAISRNHSTRMPRDSEDRLAVFRAWIYEQVAVAKAWVLIASPWQ